jgi:hypothetical protein
MSIDGVLGGSGSVAVAVVVAEWQWLWQGGSGCGCKGGTGGKCGSVAVDSVGGWQSSVSVRLCLFASKSSPADPQCLKTP